MEEDSSESKKKKENILDLIKFYFLNNKYDEAIKGCEDALKKDPKNVEILYNLGLVYESKNMLDKAKNIYEKVLEINSNHKLAKKHLDKIIGI